MGRLTATVSGAVAQINSPAVSPVESLKVDFLPIQTGSGDPSPQNIRPISGYTGLVVKHSGADVSEYTSIPVSWETEAGTVYGGSVDLVTGVLTVTDACIASYNGETLPGTWISDRDVYATGTTPTTGAQVVYKLETPLEYQLDPVTIQTLIGRNNFFSDAGNTSVTYDFAETPEMMQIRKRIMMARNPEEWYITDGLVLFFDGLNRGGESGKWVATVGGLTATLTGTYTELDDGVQFINSSGASNYGALDGAVQVQASVGTIEHVTEISTYETTGRTIISMGNGYLGGSISAYSNQTDAGPGMRYYMLASNTDFYVFPYMNKTLKFIMSANADRAICNGENSIDKISVGQLGSGTGNYMARKGNTSNPFSGIIHAIRIYNRKLTAEEMLHNQRIDNIRFNYGLTI